MICPRSWFLSLKHTTLEEEKTVGLEQNRTHISHRTWNIYQGICDRTQTTNSTVEAFATQCEAQLQTCTQSLELMPLLMEEEILAEKVRYPMRSRSIYNTMKETLERQRLPSTMHKIKSVKRPVLPMTLHTLKII